MQFLAKFIFYKLLRWELIGSFPQLDKCVIIVAPHTSWVDFPLGVVVRRIINLEINFIAKKSLFKAPFGWYFRWMGGAPIDRSKRCDTVQAAARIFEERKHFRLALAPEGTRKKVSAFKTGFYYIAKAAKVPIIMVAFDYGNRRVKVSEPHFPTENEKADFEIYHAFFKGVKGKIPDYSF